VWLRARLIAADDRLLVDAFGLDGGRGWPDVDATQYTLAEVHLNAEINFLPGAADLGWSMSGLTMMLGN
jgi:hypothetical protein